MGTLYTRTIGSLSANGKYIYPIDIDDMYLDLDILYVITNILGNINLNKQKKVHPLKEYTFLLLEIFSIHYHYHLRMVCLLMMDRIDYELCHTFHIHYLNHV